MSQIEEAQQVWYPGSEPSLEDTQEEAQGHHPRPIDSGSLASCANTPAKDHEGEPQVGRHDLPHQSLCLKNNIADIKNGQKPLVVVADKVQIGLHAGDFSITDVRAVEERKDIKGRHETDNSEVHFADDSFLDVGVDMVRVGGLLMGSFDLIAGKVKAYVLFVFDRIGGCWRGLSEEPHCCSCKAKWTGTKSCV